MANLLAWKEKYLDYEIETTTYRCSTPKTPYSSWKEKYLDYEIETSVTVRISKIVYCLKRKVSRLRDWNFGIPNITAANGRLEKKSISITRLKHADTQPIDGLLITLEKKSISITRLKHVPVIIRAVPLLRASWKEKYLDYEIETLQKHLECHNFITPWKEKYLDYEIETRYMTAVVVVNRWDLKRKVSRLRDWNAVKNVGFATDALLEKKSISITRLKPL